jgi:hypothetical protein
MHQSAVRSSRPLAARGCCWSGRERRSLPIVRRFPPQRAAAARSALAYAPALTLDAPARPAPALNRAPWSLRPPVPLLKLAHAAGPRAGDPFLAFCILLYFQIRIQKTYGNSLALGIVREGTGSVSATNRNSTLDQALFEDLFVGEPQIGDVGRAKAKDVFQRAADFAKMKINADLLEQFDQRLRTHGFDGLRANAAVVHPMVGEDVNRLGTGSMTINMEKAPGFGLGAPSCYT